MYGYGAVTGKRVMRRGGVWARGTDIVRLRWTIHSTWTLSPGRWHGLRTCHDHRCYGGPSLPPCTRWWAQNYNLPQPAAASRLQPAGHILAAENKNRMQKWLKKEIETYSTTYGQMFLIIMTCLHILCLCKYKLFMNCNSKICLFTLRRKIMRLYVGYIWIIFSV